MQLPFTKEQFVEVFKNYNTAVFPLQGIFYFIAMVAIFNAVRKTKLSSTVTVAIVSFLWIWMGLVYHIIYFSTINKAANIFGAFFLLQGTLFAYYDRKLTFKFPTDRYGVAGSLLISFGLVIYPSISYLLGHVYPNAPTFGVPCPTTIFTFGILLLTDRKCPLTLLIIPGLWSIVGISAAVNLGFYEDFGLVISGITASSMLFFRSRQVERIGKHQADLHAHNVLKP